MLADSFLSADYQVLEQVPAVFSDVKELCQHGHGQGFSKTKCAGDEIDLKWLFNQFFYKEGFVNVVTAAFYYLGKNSKPKGRFTFVIPIPSGSGTKACVNKGIIIPGKVKQLHDQSVFCVKAIQWRKREGKMDEVFFCLSVKENCQLSSLIFFTNYKSRLKYDIVV